MKNLVLVISFIGVISQSNAHEMQHGFVLAVDDNFASHLVATGHHSRQTEIMGQLLIEDPQEKALYEERKIKSAGGSYFLFQAQNLDLLTLSVGQVLTGHIVESKMGEYQPQNKIVSSAVYQVQRVLLNIPNPFFAEDEKNGLSDSYQRESSYVNSYMNNLLNSVKVEKKHCCDTGKKPCNWKC